MAETTFPLNFENKYYLNTTPDKTGGQETWSPLAAGIQNVSWAGNEVIDQTQYYDGGGLASTEVTGGQWVASVSGHRVIGDAAQDFVFGLMLEYGKKRKTQLKWERPDGKTVTADVTIANIADAAGDANAKDSISFEIHCNGAPTKTDTVVAASDGALG